MYKQKKTVLFLIPNLRGGGAERVIVTLLKRLDRDRFDLSIGVSDTSDAVFLSEIPNDVEIIDFKEKRIRFAAHKIGALIWSRRPDIVFSTLGHLNLLIAIVRILLPRGTRYLARETSIVSLNINRYRYPWIWNWMYRRFYHLFDMVICQSEYMRNDLIRNFQFPLEKSVVINNPVDIERIKIMVGDDPQHHKSSDNTIKFVAAGRLNTVKGFDFLIEAISILNDSRIKLTILGEGPLRADLEQMSIDKGVSDQVYFAGFQSNPYIWFAQADAFLLSSRYEGFPNVVLESLACGTPVIAVPSPGGTREILDSIPACVVATEVSSEALASAISSWLDSPRTRVDSASIEQYSLGSIIPEYDRILK